MKKSRFFKAEIIALAFVAVLWAVNLRTHCVARATAGTLRQVTRIAPNSQCAYELLGSTYRYLGRTDEGDKAYGRAETLACERAVKSNPTDPAAHYVLGDAYFEEERYEAAVEAYRRSIELDPNNYWACHDLGVALDWLDRYEEEIEAFQQVLRINPQDADAHFNIGDAYEKLGDFESAIRAYETVISLDSEHRDGYERLADCYWELDQPDNSIETWKRAMAADPNWAWPHMRLALDYNDVGRYEEAIAEWGYLIDREPQIAGLRVLLADVYLRTGQYDRAVTVYKEALRLDPGHVKAHYGLGRAYLQIGNIDSALNEYATLRVLNEKLAKMLRLGARYVLTVMIIANEKETALRDLSQKQQEFVAELSEQHSSGTRLLQAVDAMVAEGTITAAEGKLKQWEIVQEQSKVVAEIRRRQELDFEAFSTKFESRPDAAKLAESEMKKVDERLSHGLPLPSFRFLERGEDPSTREN